MFEHFCSNLIVRTCSNLPLFDPTFVRTYLCSNLFEPTFVRTYTLICSNLPLFEPAFVRTYLCSNLPLFELVCPSSFVRARLFELAFVRARVCSSSRLFELAFVRARVCSGCFVRTVLFGLFCSNTPPRTRPSTLYYVLSVAPFGGSIRVCEPSYT